MLLLTFLFLTCFLFVNINGMIHNKLTYPTLSFFAFFILMILLLQLGHNFNLAHSGTVQEGGDSDTYGDYTGVMGGLHVDKM